MCAQTHGCTYVQPHTSTRTYIYTPTHARVRTYTRTRRKFSDNESALQYYQTEFHHQSVSIHFYCPMAVQSVSTLAPHWLRHLYKPSASVTHLPSINNHCPTIRQQFNHLLSQLSYIITTDHHLTHIIFHLYIMSSPNHLTVLSIYQYVIKLYQFSIYLPRSHLLSHIQQISVPSTYTIIIFIMETVFRPNYQQTLLCIIIHLLIFVMKFV